MSFRGIAVSSVCAAVFSFASAVPSLGAEMTVPADFSLDYPTPGKVSITTSSNNLPLYVFDDDTPGKSNCNVGCLGPWNPVTPTGAATPSGDWKLIAREDQRQQWTYKGHPLYTYFTDEPGKPNGDGEEGKWHLFHP